METLQPNNGQGITFSSTELSQANQTQIPIPINQTHEAYLDMSEPPIFDNNKLNEAEPYTPIVDRDTYVALVIEAKNIYNQAYDFTEETQKQLAAQFSVFAVNLDTGESYTLTHRPVESEVLSHRVSPPSSTVPVKLLFVSESTLGTSGQYILKAFFTDLTQGQLQVDGCHTNHSKIETKD